MASDDDVIYVDVAARLDEKTAEQATGKLRDKFKGAGKTIGDALGSDLGQALTKELGDALGSQVESLGKAAGERLGSAIGTGIKDLASGVGIDLGGVADKISDITGSAAGLRGGWFRFWSGCGRPRRVAAAICG
jgi:hypothetical protein